jgi:hypothetical protein
MFKLAIFLWSLAASTKSIILPYNCGGKCYEVEGCNCMTDYLIMQIYWSAAVTLFSTTASAIDTLELQFGSHTILPRNSVGATNHLWSVCSVPRKRSL